MEIEEAIYSSPNLVVIVVSTEMDCLAGSPYDNGMEEGGEI